MLGSPHGPNSIDTSATAVGDLRRPRILVAEDDREMRRLLVEALREDGYAVDEAPDGVELLAHIGSSVLFGTFGSVRQPPDLIVTDVRMPGLTGLTVLAALRESGENVPVIVITAFGDDETHRFAHQHGAVAIFDKPFDLLDLRTAIADVLQPERRDAPNPKG